MAHLFTTSARSALRATAQRAAPAVSIQHEQTLRLQVAPSKFRGNKTKEG